MNTVTILFLRRLLTLIRHVMRRPLSLWFLAFALIHPDATEAAGRAASA